VDEEFVCGWGAAFINITATFPINKAIFRQQLHGISGFKVSQCHEHSSKIVDKFQALTSTQT
jgi:hypothetical protein